jgi:uncharacterized protein
MRFYMARIEPSASLRFVDFPWRGPTEQIAPLVSADSRPFYDALARGTLLLQRCGQCQRFRHPPAPVCPYCASAQSRWAAASGKGTVHSFTKYHRSFLPAFEALIPYSVVNVQLAEGPRLIGRLVSKDQPSIGADVEMVVERWADDLCVPAFELCGGAP